MNVFVDKHIPKRPLIELAVKEAIKTFPWELEFEGFEVRVPFDFKKTVLDIQKRCNKRPGYTNTNRSVAPAKTIVGQRNGKRYQYIILDLNFVVSYFQGAKRKILRHIIHHELGHVYCNTLGNRPTRDDVDPELDIIYRVLYDHANSLWDEYFAERTANGSWDPSMDFNYEHLINLAASITDDIAKIEEEYEVHNGDYDVSYHLQIGTSTLLRVAAMAFAESTALDDDEKKSRYSGLWERIEPKGLLADLQNMEKELSQLYDTYSNGEQTISLHSLSNIVLNVWEELGIYPEYRDPFLVGGN